MTVALTTSAFAADTDDVWLVLIKIDHADLAEPIRVVNNMEDITSSGDLYVGFPFDITLPDSREDAAPRARLSIDNVSREIAEAIRTITGAPDVTISVIRAADPDMVEITWPSFIMRNVKWDVDKVYGDLVLEDFTSEPYPAGVFSPASFPGLF